MDEFCIDLVGDECMHAEVHLVNLCNAVHIMKNLVHDIRISLCIPSPTA